MWGRFSLPIFLALGSLAGCGAPPAPMSASLRLKVTGNAPRIDGLVLTGVNTKLEKLTVYGDVAPDPRTTMPDTDVDLLQGATISYEQLAPGLYSLLRFVIDDLSLDGSYRGAPVHALFEFGETTVSLRSKDGMEVAPDHPGRFTVIADMTQWLTAADLDAADRTGSEILVAPSHNPTRAASIASRVPSSFTFQSEAETDH